MLALHGPAKDLGNEPQCDRCHHRGRLSCDDAGGRRLSGTPCGQEHGELLPRGTVHSLVAAGDEWQRQLLRHYRHDVDGVGVLPVGDAWDVGALLLVLSGRGRDDGFQGQVGLPERRADRAGMADFPVWSG